MEKVLHIVVVLILCILSSSCGKKTDSSAINAATMAESEFTLWGTAFLHTGKFVEQKGVRPDRGAREFSIFQETRLKEIKTLNHLDLADGARSIKIVGLNLEIGPQLSSQIYERIHDKGDIQRLEIDAETIVIKDTILLPQADVIIRAKNLFFENNAKIDTSPKAFPVPAAQFKNGLKGLNAGNFEIYVENILPAIRQPRFISHGGAGQDAGAGQLGIPGTDASVTSTPMICQKAYQEHCEEISNPIDHRHSKRRICFDRELVLVPGNNCTCPTSGNPGKAGGHPGEGGQASKIISSLPFEDVDNYFSSVSGLPGASAGVLKGGRAGLPAGAFIQIRRGHEHPEGRENCPTSEDGPDVFSPILVAATTQGEIESRNYLEAMSQSLYSTFKLKFANELFSQGHTGEAEKEYSEIVDFSQKFSPQQKSDLLAQAEMLALQKLYNLELRLDYYGHPPSWMPGLDLNTSRALYLNQIDDYLEMLYLSSWLQNRDASINAQRISRELAVKKFYEQLEIGYSSSRKLFEEIPQVKNDLEGIGRDEKILLDRIEQLTREIEQTAQANLEDEKRKKKTKRILLGLAALTKSIPAGQPALGGAGSIIETILRVQDSDDGFSRLKEIPALFQSVVGVTRLQQSQDDWNGNYQKISFSDFQGMSSKERYAYLEKIKNFYSPIAEELGNQVALWKKLDITPAAIKAEVELIKASHGIYQELLSRVLKLQDQKSKLMKFLTELEQIMGQIEAERIVLSNQVTRIQEDIADDVQDLSPESVILLSEYEQMALDRLKMYRYQMIKAYNYEYLEPSKESIGLDSVWNELRRIVKEEQAVDLAGDKIKSLKAHLKDDLRKMAQQIYDAVELGKRSYFETSYSFYLTPRQLEMLNRGESVHIDTTEFNFFPHDEEDIRIKDIKLIESVTEVAVNQAASDKRMTIEINHPGKFYIKKDSEIYYFERTDLARSSQFSWVYVYDGAHPHGFPMEHISPLRSLFSDFLIFKDENLNFVRPGGLTELELRPTYYNSTKHDYNIKSLGVEISYECRRRRDTSPAH
ncbi:MAG: hypothetical protein A2X86_06290 [Bdellovibrionales bacterium GWA2_49_15]|nr:MAG: hypothetical protein A2X86_06290 [Bdellovibrionales bacterium GWA2_49_15]HAZ12118.1 hypothetical protein [Bdellovibrionales bacterium]